MQPPRFLLIAALVLTVAGGSSPAFGQDDGSPEPGDAEVAIRKAIDELRASLRTQNAEKITAHFDTARMFRAMLSWVSPDNRISRPRSWSGRGSPR